MRVRPFVLSWFFVLLASTASAQDAEGALARAEEAYLGVDFDGTREHAMAALREGGHASSELVRIYLLLGISSAALGDEDAARDYFVRMLGLDPNAELDESVPPRLRNPFLEARGVSAARGARLGVETGLDRASSALHVEISDPTAMARRVRVAARLEGGAEYSVAEYPAAAVLNAEVAGAADAERVEYYVEVLDMHGNVILSTGSPFSPRVVGRTATGGGGGGGATVFEEPLFWIIVAAVVLVAGAITTGVAVDSRSRIGLQTGIRFGI